VMMALRPLKSSWFTAAPLYSLTAPVMPAT
jgi:hypothetical protein